MSKTKKLFAVGLTALMLIGFAGCGGVTEEQMAQLDALKAEVKSLRGELNSLNSEKTRLEREIAEKKAKLEECAKDKEETRRNLQKMGMN